jgi:hypothetical protein
MGSTLLGTDASRPLIWAHFAPPLVAWYNFIIYIKYVLDFILELQPKIKITSPEI